MQFSNVTQPTLIDIKADKDLNLIIKYNFSNKR